MFQGDERIPPAYAILGNISERGACVQSDRVLARGQYVQVRIQFEEEEDLFEAAGRIAWTRLAQDEDDAGFDGAALSGIEFSLTSQSILERLRRVLLTSHFEEPRAGGAQFEDFVRALRPYLDRLGGYLSRVAAARNSSLSANKATNGSNGNGTADTRPHYPNS